MAISTSVVYYRVSGNARMYSIRLNIKMNIKVAYVLMFYDLPYTISILIEERLNILKGNKN